MRERRNAGTILAVPLLLACLAAPRPAMGQNTGLSKSELVRLVVSGAAAADKVATVRSRCLSFEPTEGDWRDLRNLGASDEVLAAAQECARAALAVRVAWSATNLTVTAGDSASVSVTLSRSGSPVTGQSVTLSGSGSGSARLSRSSDGRGRATFRIPAGPRAGAMRYSLTAPGISLEGNTRITVSTVAAAPVRATVSPASLELEEEQVVPDLRVTVEDTFANPTSGASIRLLAGPGAAPVIGNGTADGSGQVLFRPGPADLPDSTATWEVRSGDLVLARIPVRVRRTPDPVPPAAVVAAPGAVALAEPSPVDAAVHRGISQLEAGDAGGAEQTFREALRTSPRRIDAQKGLAAALLVQGRSEEAVTWYELATRQDPGDADAWFGLGRAHAESGHRDAASAALARARELEPGREEVAQEISGLDRSPGYARGSLWGGTTDDSGESGGFRRGEIEISVSGFVRLSGGWDRSLAPRSPEIIRGPDEWDGWFGGAALSYGPGQRLETEAELGQRKQTFGTVAEGAELAQNLYRLTQTIRLSDSQRGAEVKLGGYLFRWYDTDDWIVFGRFRAPVGRQLSFVSSLSYGKTIGTNWVESGRHSDKDGRAYLGVAWETPKGLRLEPAFGVGSVSSDRDDALSGTLIDLLFEGVVPVGSVVDIRLFLRHQRPPGIEPFTVIAAGLGLRLGWAGG